MKTSVIEVRDMLSVLSVVGIEELIGKVPGVESVTMNYAAGNATVRYDETRLEIADIKAAARQIGYEAAAPPATTPTTAKPSPSAMPKPAPAATAAAPAPKPASPDSPPGGTAAPASAAPAGHEHDDKAAPEKS